MTEIILIFKIFLTPVVRCSLCVNTTVFGISGATWYGLIRSALALSGLVLFLPLAGLATVLLPVAAAGKFLAESDEILRLGTTSLLALLPVFLSLYLGRLKALHTSLASFLGWLQVRI